MGVKILCNAGYIKKQKFNEYTFTDLGNGLYMSFVRLMDHKTRDNKV